MGWAIMGVMGGGFVGLGWVVLRWGRVGWLRLLYKYAEMW